MSTPTITSQRVSPILAGKNKVTTINMTQLYVDDPDFPGGLGKDWVIEAQAGAHYTVDQDSGVVESFDLMPTANYTGSLSVAVKLSSDGGSTWSSWFGLNILVVEVPVISNQTSFPKVYIGSYLTITLNNLIVVTSKIYPQQFTLLASTGIGYSVISSTSTSVKILIEGNLSTTSRSIPVRVNDGSIWSDAYNYIVNVVAKPATGRPAAMGVSITAPSPFEQPFRRV
jgi:hypothetical protein